MSIRILTSAECSTAIGRIAAAGKVLQDRVHTVAVSTLDHIRQHGDYTLAVRLLDALPNGVRVKSLAYWYSHFSKGKVKFSQNKDKTWKCNLAADRTDADFDIEGAYATTFADLTSEKSPETLDVKALEKWLARTAGNSDYFPGTAIRKVSPEAQELASRLVVNLRAALADKQAA
ncbi:MAG: hypothetical protein ABSD12_27325 [Paraburkholderia sp.]